MTHDEPETYDVMMAERFRRLRLEKGDAEARRAAAWVKHFVKPVARLMRERGISEVRIKIGKDGKASYLLEPDAEWLGDSIHGTPNP